MLDYSEKKKLKFPNNTLPMWNAITIQVVAGLNQHVQTYLRQKTI